MSQADLFDVSMDSDHHISPAVRNSSTNESSPLLKDESSLRPYQAYCVTEASSRPATPDKLIPQPLRVRSSFSQERDHEPRYVPSSPLLTSPATVVEQDRSLAIVRRPGNESNNKEEPSNGSPRSRNTMLVNLHHITQTVTPRGSHPLTTIRPMVYDPTLSQSRMQQVPPEYVATCPAYRRKPLPQYVEDASMAHRPLPSLPVDATPTHHDLSESELWWHNARPHEVDRHRTPYSPPLCSSLEEPMVEPCHHSPVELPLSSEADYGPSYSAEFLTSSNVHLPEQHPPIYTVPHNGWSFRGRDANFPSRFPLNSPKQLSSSAELYVPRGLLSGLSDMDDDRRAYRRTQPKDAKFKYTFGRRPTTQLDVAPTTPTHRPQHMPSFKIQPSIATDAHLIDDYPSHLSPPPTSRSYNDAQAGPRPPPWGSLDNLEMRRHTRSDFREREDARKYRLKADGKTSLSKGSVSMESLRGDAMRREVLEYREQVLQLYPDMEFDGSAGHGGRTCCCAVM